MRRTRRGLRRHERIQLTQSRQNSYPRRFRWRGRNYDVAAVQEAWTKMQRGPGRSARHYFRVRCTEGIYEIFRDTKLDTWYLAAQIS